MCPSYSRYTKDMDINFVFGIEGRAAVAKKAEDLELQLRDGKCDGNRRHRRNDNQNRRENNRRSDRRTL